LCWEFATPRGKNSPLGAKKWVMIREIDIQAKEELGQELGEWQVW
jgi:hypothetical protein